MSLSYRLELETKLEPQQLLQLLVERHNLKWHRETILQLSSQVPQLNCLQ